jgi:hypothetical protein
VLSEARRRGRRTLRFSGCSLVGLRIMRDPRLSGDKEITMDDRNAQLLYLRRRMSDSRAMALTAAGPCAKIAHIELARLYGEAIDGLAAQSTIPSVDAPLPIAA